MNTRHLILVAVLLLIGGAPAAFGGALTINGYYKNFSVGYDAPYYQGRTAAEQEPMLGIVTNRLRCNLAYRFNDLAAVSISYNLVPRVQDRSLFNQVDTAGAVQFPAYRFADFDARIYPAAGDDPRSFGVFHNLDRALLTINTTRADIYLGRQAIAWGSARAVNPSDILAPFSFDELDTEDRRGVDAVRIRFPLGMMGEFDVGYVAGDDFAVDQSAMFLRGKSYLAQTDVSLIVATFREHLMAGVDLTRAVGGASVWIEAAQVFTHAFDDTLRISAEDYFRASVGADYALSGTVYGFIEYHYSQAGTDNSNDYLRQTSQPAFTDGAVYLWGEHYLIPGLSWQITPLITGNAQSLINITDPSVLITPQVEYNIAENIYLAAGAYIGVGASPKEIKTTDNGPNVMYDSEFGAYSDMYFTSFRVYF